MASLCSECGKNAFDSNDQVCHGCGVVKDEIFLDSGFNPFSSDTRPRLHLYPQKKNPDGLKYAISMLDNLIHKYSLSSHTKSAALHLLNNVYSTMSFSRKQDIGILAGCCLIHVQKKNRHFISLTDLCRKLGCSKKKAFKFTNVLKKHCNASTEGHSSNMMVVETEDLECKDIDMSQKLESSIVSLLSSLIIDNKEKLIEKTKALTELANSCWLISGRSPEGVIVAAVYLCWKSMYPRNNLPFKKFCSEHSLPYVKGTGRLSEMKDMLIKLGQNIPSFAPNFINEKNVFYHLDYILKNSETLRNDLLLNEFTAKEIDKKEYSAFRKKKTKVNNSGQPDNKVEDKYEPDMCVSDVDISDTEISSYIRTQEQVDMIKALRGENDS